MSKKVDDFVDKMGEIIAECEEKVGPDAIITREDYEIAAIEAYAAICLSYTKGTTEPKQVVAMGTIFDMVHNVLDIKYGVKKEVNRE